MIQRHSVKRRAETPPDFFSADVAKARRFYLNLNPLKDIGLAVVCGGLEHSTPLYSIHRATFPYYAIEYVARGSGEVQLKHHRYPLQRGSLFSYGPGIPHHISGSVADPLVKYFVDFAGSGAHELLRSCHLLPGHVSQVFPANGLDTIFDEIIESGCKVGHGNIALCTKLLECLALKIAGTRAPLEAAETLAFSTYQQCRNLIAQHYLRLRTLREISTELNVTSAHLCRLFQRYDHQSPYQLLLHLKMNAAAERLGQAGALVKQVAEEMGFSDPFHFSRVFKSVLGVSPVTLRRLR